MIDDSFREAVDARLKHFVSDAIEAAGGPKALAFELGRLGFAGRADAYNEQSVRAWRRGSRVPGAEVVFAIARRFDLDLNKYARGEPARDDGAQLDELVARLAHLERVQTIILAWASEDDSFAERLKTHAPELLEQVGA